MHADVQHFQPTEPFTVFRAVPLKAELLASLDAHPGGMVLDLSAVGEIDTAGVQLLLMLEREAASRSCALSLRAPSPPVRAVLELLGLSSLLPVLSAEAAEAPRGRDG